jgi:hypothetical protein
MQTVQVEQVYNWLVLPTSDWIEYRRLGITFVSAEPLLTRCPSAQIQMEVYSDAQIAVQMTLSGRQLIEAWRPQEAEDAPCRCNRSVLAMDSSVKPVGASKPQEAANDAGRWSITAKWIM